MDYNRTAAVAAGLASAGAFAFGTGLEPHWPLTWLARSARSATAPLTLLAARVEVRHDATVYAQYGDWFGWLCVIVAAGVMGRLAMLGSGRPTREDPWKATG